MNTTASTIGVQPVSLEKMRQVMLELELTTRPTEWLLCSPDGKMWNGKPEELLQVLMPHHPLLKPSPFNFPHLKEGGKE